MKIELIKASGRCLCRGISCPANPEHVAIVGRYGDKKIVKGTTCAAISMWSAGGWNTSYYCRDCIQIIHDEMRKILNPKLWAFL